MLTSLKSRMLRPQWLAAAVAAVLLAEALAYGQFALARSDHYVYLRVAVTAEGRPVRPLSELASWLNGQTNSAKPRLKWRPFIASIRYEGRDARLAVLQAKVTGFETPVVGGGSGQEAVSGYALQALRLAESELAAGLEPVAADSQVLWVKASDDPVYLFWLLALGAIAAPLLVLNLCALRAERERADMPWSASEG